MSFWKSRPRNLDSNYFCNAVRPVWHNCAYNRTMENIEWFCMCILTKVFHWQLFTSLHPMGNQLSLYSRLFTLLVPVNIPMSYNATLHLVMEIDGHTIVCEEIIFRVKRKLLSILKYLIRLCQLPSPLIPAPQAFVFLLDISYESPSHKMKY